MPGRLSRLHNCAWQGYGGRLFCVVRLPPEARRAAPHSMQDASCTGSSFLSRAPCNLLDGLPTLRALRALGTVIPGTELFEMGPRPGLSASDLLLKVSPTMRAFESGLCACTAVAAAVGPAVQC